MTNRDHYPPDWPRLSRQCKERAGWVCQGCGAHQYEQRISRRGVPYFIYLHAAHLNNDPANPEPELVCLCISCHARLDYQRKQREARIRLEQLKHLLLLIEQGVVEVRVELNARNEHSAQAGFEHRLLFLVEGSFS